MRSVKLKEFSVSDGGSVNPAKHKDEIFDLYSISAYDTYKPEILPGAAIGSAKKVVQTNDVLISRIVPHIRRVWVVGPNNGRRQIASGEWIIYRGDSFDPNYLRHVLMADHFHQQFMKTVSGIGGSLLRARPSEVEKVKIPLPPLPEQKRIASILNKADAIRRKRQAAIKLADDFLRATFLDMFGDPVTNPKGWEVRTIRQLLADIPNAARTGPFGSQLKHSEFTGEGIPVLGIDNVVTNVFRWASLRCLPPEKYEQFKRYRVFPEDLIITIMGTTGRVSVAPSDLPECMSTKHLCVLTLNKDKIAPVFLWATLLFDNKVRNQAKSSSCGAIMEGWNMGIIKNIDIRVPPIKIQRVFRSIFEKSKRLKEKQTAWEEDNSNLLFNSLIQRAFQGEL
jgi:type I restriction enzyme S subunit